MAVDFLQDTSTFDFALSETGDIATTTQVVQQDAWKQVVMAAQNFIFDDVLGSYLYQVPQYGNTAAARSLAAGYIRLALAPEIADGRLSIESVDVSQVTNGGCTFTVRFRDLTTGATTVLSND